MATMKQSITSRHMMRWPERPLKYIRPKTVRVDVKCSIGLWLKPRCRYKDPGRFDGSITVVVVIIQAVRLVWMAVEPSNKHGGER